MCILSKSDYKIGGILSQIIKFLRTKVIFEMQMFDFPLILMSPLEMVELTA